MCMVSSASWMFQNFYICIYYVLCGRFAVVANCLFPPAPWCWKCKFDLSCYIFIVISASLSTLTHKHTNTQTHKHTNTHTHTRTRTHTHAHTLITLSMHTHTHIPSGCQNCSQDNRENKRLLWLLNIRCNCALLRMFVFCWFSG